MKTLVYPLALIALVAAGIGLFAWSPWSDDTRPKELAWLRAYSAWLDATAEREPGQAECQASFDNEVGDPPGRRLEPIAELAHDGCASFPDPADWRTVGWDGLSRLVDWHEARADTTEQPALGAVAEGIAGKRAETYCWTGDEWRRLEEEWNLLDPRDIRPAGFADPIAGEIHLSPEICEPLRRFLETSYAPYLSTQALELADALTTLAHEAEHVRDEHASEAEVECRAIQEVRDIVLAEGRRPAYADELALLAWEISYPLLPRGYQTDRCRDGGPLDTDPDSPVWP